MDISKITSTLLSADSIKGICNATGASKKDVTGVLTAALPSLLTGATNQAKDESTAADFATALSDHAKSDTSNLLSFLGGVDLLDGSKIIGHLLGGGADDVKDSVSKASGVSKKNTASILAAVAPLLMSLLGQQADEDDKKESGIASLFGGLLDNVNLGSLLNVAPDDDEEEEKDDKKESSGFLSGLLGKLFK